MHHLPHETEFLRDFSVKVSEAESHGPYKGTYVSVENALFRRWAFALKIGKEEAQSLLREKQLFTEFQDVSIFNENDELEVYWHKGSEEEWFLLSLVSVEEGQAYAAATNGGDSPAAGSYVFLSYTNLYPDAPIDDAAHA